MNNFITVIIPNRNGEKTIGRCLDALYASEYRNFETIVVDDFSDDASTGIIERYPCRLIRLSRHSGASRARNEGAEKSEGTILFFIDADCLVKKDTLTLINRAFTRKGSDVILGGTYTEIPHDDSFFSTFQSVFIHYSETKNADDPDYVATHAMIIGAEAFRKSGGFAEDFLPLIEDVEFSHRMKRRGLRLFVEPEIQVTHIFNFSLMRSLHNAYRKSKYWTLYSLRNKDILRDSGTASRELKVNMFIFFAFLCVLLLALLTDRSLYLATIPVIALVNVITSRRLIASFYRAKGMFFALLSLLYYMILYPLPVWIGAIAGTIKYLYS